MIEEFFDFLLEAPVSALLGILLLYGIIHIIFSYILKRQRDFGLIISRWFHLFDGKWMSGIDIYNAIEDSLNDRKIPGIKVDKTTYHAQYIFGKKREYLRVRRGDHLFLICAASFGNNFFVSWWFGERPTFATDFWPRVPFIGNRIANVLLARTFFQSDADSIFSELVRHCVNEVLQESAKEKGMRQMTDRELDAIEKMSQKVR